MRQMQAEGTRLQPILEAFRDEPCLTHARLSVLQGLLFSEMRHHPEDASGEAEEAEASPAEEAEASPALADEMRQLQGRALDEFFALLEWLASAEQFKVSCRQLFTRLLNLSR